MYVYIDERDIGIIHIFLRRRLKLYFRSVNLMLIIVMVLIF